MRRRIALLGLVALLAVPATALAAHVSTNQLVFAPVAGSPAPDVSWISAYRPDRRQPQGS